jgi:AraC-like DNA-binding protein
LALAGLTATVKAAGPVPPADTTALTGAIISPQNRSIITSNTVRISVRAGGAGVRSVDFFARYIDPNRNKDTVVQIGTDSAAPYEITWDCSRILDQSGRDLFLYAQINDSAKNAYPTERTYIILDRNPGLSARRFISWRSGPKVIDGVLEREWLDQEPVKISNDDNVYRIYSCWDRRCLYFAADVTDKSVFTRSTDTNEVFGWDSVLNADTPLQWCWRDDGVAFFFDLNYNRSPLLDSSHHLLYISAAGQFQAIRQRQIDVRHDRYYNWGKQIRVSAKRKAGDTLGYVIEAAIPWQSLGIKPHNNREIGFEAYLTDREEADGPRIISSWSCIPNNHENPSEWGTLVLRENVWPYYLFTVIGLLLAVASGFGIFLYRKSAGKRQAISQSRQQQICGEAEEYIRKNFKNQALNRDLVAESLNLNSSYFGAIFKKHTGRTLPEYINQLRIEEAVKLLADTGRTVTDIAFESGFGSLDHFIRTFKAIKGVTPNEFRKNRP